MKALPVKDGQQFIGDYLIIQQLGVGTTGKVKLAQHQVTGKQVAIKVISKSKFLQKPELQRKIRREIALMRLLDHPHLLKLVEVCESQRRLYIVLEYASHGELFDYLVKKRSLALDEALSFFRQLIYGLDFLHRHTICHRDLKPENILLDENDRVKIADFGFARWMRANVAETSCGSPHYAAPEVIKGLAYDGRAADVWSCGVIFYALLAGHLPFDDPSVRNLMAKVKLGRYQMPPFLPEIQDLISRMLAVDPTKRITIDQIKEHPGFKLGFPKNYLVPSPLPLPSLPDPIPVDRIDAKVFSVLTHLGYSDERDVKAELESSESNMAKVFYHMMTSTMSVEILPWEGETLEGMHPSEDNFMVEDNAPVVFTSSDPFHRERITQALSLGSPDLYSFVEREAAWPEPVDAAESGVPDGRTVIGKVGVSLEKVAAGIQQLLANHSYPYFYPNDATIITRIYEGEMMYVIIRLDYCGRDEVTISADHIHGTAVQFSSFIHLIDEFLESYT